MRLFYSAEYVNAGYAFDTTRKAAWIADSLARDPIAHVELAAPAPLERNDLLRVHAPEYVMAVEIGFPQALAESQGFAWDEGIWASAIASNGGVVAAALEALDYGVAGSLSSGLHHARRNRGLAFCTFNGLVLAADAAVRRGAERVLILDLDAHGGGGTASLIADEPRIRQIDVWVSELDVYAANGQCRIEGVTSARKYLTTVSELLESADRYDLCIYNAGMDPHEDCGIGGLDGIGTDILAEREKTVFAWAKRTSTPIAFVLAGGYVGRRLNAKSLVELHRLTISEAARLSS